MQDLIIYMCLCIAKENQPNGKGSSQNIRKKEQNFMCCIQYEDAVTVLANRKYQLCQRFRQIMSFNFYSKLTISHAEVLKMINKTYA